jgi:CTP:molybdopterin cytidylyltransferase MocA
VAKEAEERLSGIVLAAGAGVRMGGPKALLMVDGEPLASVHARRLREAGCRRVVIVTRAELAARFFMEAEVAVSAAPDPAGSLAIGLRALAPLADDVLVITPVDAWPALVATVGRLVRTVRSGADAATPTRDARGGHPVALRARVLDCDAPRPLRDVLNDLGAKRMRVQVDDPGIAVDLDTPDDVQRATGAPPRFA